MRGISPGLAGTGCTPTATVSPLVVYHLRHNFRELDCDSSNAFGVVGDALGTYPLQRWVCVLPTHSGAVEGNFI